MLCAHVRNCTTMAARNDTWVQGTVKPTVKPTGKETIPTNYLIHDDMRDLGSTIWTNKLEIKSTDRYWIRINLDWKFDTKIKYPLNEPSIALLNEQARSNKYVLFRRNLYEMEWVLCKLVWKDQSRASSHASSCASSSASSSASSNASQDAW